MSARSPRVRRAAIVVALTLVALAGWVGVVAASNVVAGLAQSRGDVSVPTWLYLATGGGAIGASALLSMLVTDRDVIEGFHDRSIESPLAGLGRAGAYALGTVGVLGFVLVLVVGIVGPRLGSVNAAVLVTFVGVRAALTTVTYTVGNPWPAIDPWRRIADVLPTGFRTYPDELGSWPAVALLLTFVLLEIVAPLSSSPTTLIAVIGAYTAYTLVGAVVFGPAGWFRRADPVSTWFRLYGAVAPLQRTDDGIAVRPPGARLSDPDVISHRSEIAFAIALVWELTYSGFVVTPHGVWTVETLVGFGIPPVLVYLGTLVLGFVLFWRTYWFAARRARDRAETYLSTEYLALRFAPPLLAIAAGYHLAHYLGFALSLWPSLLASLSAPLSPPVNPTVLALPAWFGYVEITGILLGHVLAIWVAHTVSFELFPGKLQAIRSQYPFVLVMIAFTVVSLWLVSLPTVGAAYAPG